MAVDMIVLEQASAVLQAIWDGIDRDYKSKYRADIWAQLQSRAAAQARMTNDLATFISRLSGAFDGATLAPGDPTARSYLQRILYLSPSEQRSILAALREQTAVCVLLLRTQKQEEKEAHEAATGSATAARWGATNPDEWLTVPSAQPSTSATEETEETEE